MTIDFLHLVVVLAKTPFHDEVDRVCDEVDEDFKHLEGKFMFVRLLIIFLSLSIAFDTNLKEHGKRHPKEKGQNSPK